MEQAVSVMNKLSKDVVENGTVAPIVYFVDMTKANPTTPEMDESAKKLVESVEALNGIMLLVKSSDTTSHHSRRVRQAPAPAAPGTPAPAPTKAPKPIDINNVNLYIIH